MKLKQGINLKRVIPFFYFKNNESTYRNRESLDSNDGRGLRNERANCPHLYSERMRTQLDDLRKELKDIDAILYYDKRKRSLTAEKKAELEKRGSEIRTIIYNIQ